MKTYYQHPSTVITTMKGVNMSGGGWAYQPPQGVKFSKSMVKAKTLPELYVLMADNGLAIDPRCGVSKLVNPCPSKLMVSKSCIKVRIDIMDEDGITSQPQFYFAFNKDSIVSFTDAMTNALNILKLEKMNRRLLKIIKSNCGV